MNPWEAAKTFPFLLAYTIEGLWDEQQSLVQRQATIEAQLQALATHPWQQTRFRRRLLLDAIRGLQADQQQLEQRQAEIGRWLPELEAKCARDAACWAASVAGGGRAGGRSSRSCQRAA